ncbi:snapalysin family zinc-dependent metalloprotease [Spirilliplanes yamanashiensis]|uniref:Extracellular small neutral protease n=1 Tax=Spirilliplanes yamanashiensis TaxID=42233 RepID=A0A8J4DJ82_9ACTN|nr:snapalysin family zinc-dependent metalloprotease [Spirilliplanes yamanashiensis]MDP9815074.1 snapalysin [Spirilliplanes yamanashiensis]GIJ02730.1 hypothetical protein Sya03_20820 [Spirilliplanes yamanashiensis]
MSKLRLVVAALVAATAALLAPTAPASAAAAPRVLYYDTSRAAEFVAAVHQGAANWNSSVTSVRLEPVTAGRRADITVSAGNGWPYASVRSLGRGSIVMGRQAVTIGHHPPRIAAHEFGHILGLPDLRTGLCTDLMSGSSAPASCRNAFPTSTEAARVQANFATSRQIPAAVYAESAPR